MTSTQKQSLSIANINIRAMKDDLLILKILKIPVMFIKYLSKFVAMLTYLPNYLLILVLDTIIFNSALCSSLLLYSISWPFRFLSLAAVIAVFIFEFYGLYALLNIQHFHWALQLALSVVAFQAVLALMRHGYLIMINKFSPTKLKSPKEHLQQLWWMVTDTIGLLLMLVNMLLVINIASTLSFSYSPQRRYNFLTHISKLIHKSILDNIRLFYISIFFRLFPWRYIHSKQHVDQEQNNILQLMVLLSLLFLETCLDLFMFVLFGIYCRVLHPRRSLYARNLCSTHEKYKVTSKFLLNSTIEISECIILLFCFPFKWSYCKQLLTLVVDGRNDYTFHYVPETMFILKLALVKIPALICELVVLVLYYKHRKIEYLMRDKYSGHKDNFVNFQSKLKAAPSGQEPDSKNWRNVRHSEREYFVFSSFASLLVEIPFYPLILLNTLLKPWNAGWVFYLVNENHDLRIELVTNYFVKNVRDYVFFVPALILSLILCLYDPLRAKQILQKVTTIRKKLKQHLPNPNQQLILISQLIFYKSSSAIIPIIAYDSMIQLKYDILFIPLFFGIRMSMMCLMGCPRPVNSVELVQKMWTQMYMHRLRRSGNFQEYQAMYNIDEAAGMLITHREKLRFWKFAYKSVRHRLISKIICFLLPTKMGQKAKANAEICRNLSAISNHYWHQYNTTILLLKYFAAFVIELIVTLIGVMIMMPLTLWRIPTFLILFKTHELKKKMFFSILFPIYKQMLRDILTLPIKIIAFLLFPRACCSFYFRNSFNYGLLGVSQFEKVQIAKLWFIGTRILKDGVFLYLLLWKVLFVKLFWIRKRDMNDGLSSKNIRLSIYMKDFLTTPQYIPKIAELLQLYNAYKNSINLVEADPKDNKFKDINGRGKQIEEIVHIFLRKTIEDIPYLLLMLFLLGTLPWRFYYIRNALFLMRDDQNHRGQFLRLLKLVAKDYQCILLYFILLLSIVRTKRAIILFYRNFKLNFYIGTLKYSNLKELRQETKQAAHFYKSIVILLIGCFFGPYRIAEVYTAVRSLYCLYCDEKLQEETNKNIYQNTIKQGKSLELITNIGSNSLEHVFRFLDARELTRMTSVCRYMYDIIKQRDEVWMDQWDRIYSIKYPTYKMQDESGSVSYNAMCISKFKQENIGHEKDKSDRFYKLAIREFKKSTFETSLDIKQELRKRLTQQKFDRIFTSLVWNEHEGYGPRDNWPRETDNPEFIALFNIQRRQIEQLNEGKAFESWFFQRPCEFFILKLDDLFGVDSHRRKKQLLYIVLAMAYPSFMFVALYHAWSWFWEFTPWFGYKLLLTVYITMFNFVFYGRFKQESNRWITLHPFDLKQDFINYWNSSSAWVSRKSIAAKQFICSTLDKYLVQPIKIVGRFIGKKARQFGRKAEYYGNLFVEKVAKPLYISISDKVIATWRVLREIFNAFRRSVKIFFKFLKNVVVGIYQCIFSIVKSISSLYSNFLEFSLRLSLKFGTFGELVFTILIIAGMISPSIMCYLYCWQRWLIIFSTLGSLVLVVTGYKHLNRMKEKVLASSS